MYGYDDNSDEQTETPGMKQLRQALEKANAALKVKDEELTKMAGKVKTLSVGEILRDLGVKPKVANLIPSDLEPTKESVSNWVKEYEDVFGAALRIEAKPESGVDKVENEAPGASRPDVDDATADALARLQNAETAAGVVPPDREQAQIAALKALEAAAGGSSSALVDILSGKASLPST